MSKNVSFHVNTERECDCCGQVVNRDEMVEVSVDCCTDLWCKECAEDTVICEHCGRHTDETHSVSLGCQWRDGRYMRVHEDWCMACVDEDATVCDDCGEYVADNWIDSYEVWGRWSNSTRYLCDNCVDNSYRTCEDCGVLVHEDDVEWDSYDDSYCPDCYQSRGNSEHIQSYGHTNGTYFWGDDGEYKCWGVDKSVLYLGIELEIDDFDDRCEFAERVTDCYDSRYFELKEDGSLEEGVEVVSQPMTPKFHLESDIWERVTTTARECGGSSHDAGTCGLHIHGSRDAFKSHDAVYRLDRLFHRFETELVKFSRRTGSQLHWCRFDADVDEFPVSERKDEWEAKKLRRDRYEAVNDTNPATVEIRLWRGTLNMETLRATIELTAGLIYVANALTNYSVETPDWAMLKSLVRTALEGHGLPHDDLDKYLVRRGL